MPQPACPSPAVLESFASDAAPDPAVRAHVEECDACRAALRDIMENNRFLAGARSAFIITQHTSDEPPTHSPGEEPPDVVPGYTLLEEIHRGGQGVVYRAVQNQARRFVAIKMLLGGSHATHRQKERFEREARIAAGLRHPNIVTLYDSGYLADGRFAFAMEYIDGPTLDKWSRTLDNLTGRDAPRRALRRRMALMSKVCDAALCAHQHAVVHRDLKPGNILVDSKDEPHVLDFGIAKRFIPRGPDHETIIGAPSNPLHAASQSHLTHPGEFAGTLAYAAPEQVAGDPERIDTRTDIYALGVLMYDLVSGRLPYIVDGPLRDAVRNIETAEPAPLGGRTHDPYGRWVDEDAATIILKAMAKDPARRYQTAAGLKNDIDNYLAGRPIDARRDSSWYVVRKNAMRHKGLIAGLAVVALALVLGAGVAGYGLFQASGARQREAFERERAATVGRASRMTVRLFQNTFLPQQDYPDDAELGRGVKRGLQHLQVGVDVGAFARDPEEQSTARTAYASLAITYLSLPLAEVSYRQAIASIIRQHGENHPALAEALHDLADVLRRRGGVRLADARATALKAVEIRRTTLRHDDPALASSLVLLARIVLESGDAAAAEAPCVEADGILRAAPKPDPTDLVTARLTLSRIHARIGRPEESEREAIEALLACLASCDDDDQLVVEAIRRCAEAIAARTEAPLDPRFASSLATEARAAASASLLAAAERLDAKGTALADVSRHAAGLEAVLSLKTAFLGADSMSQVQTLAWLAADFHVLDDMDAVESVARRIVPALEARLGPDDQALVQPRFLIWSSLLGREDYPAAVEERRRIMRIWLAQPALARDDVWIASEHRWLAETLALAGQFDEARSEYLTAIDTLTRAGRTDHYLNAVCTGGLAWTALHLGRPDEAESLARKAVAAYELAPGAPEDQRFWLQRHLAHILLARGALDEAGPLLESFYARYLHQEIHGNQFTYGYHVLRDLIAYAGARHDAEAVAKYTRKLEEARRKPTTLAPR